MDRPTCANEGEKIQLGIEELREHGQPSSLSNQNCKPRELSKLFALNY